MTINLKNLLNPKVKMSKMGEFQELQPIEGLEISAISADLYGDGRDDLTLFYFDEGANFGAVYTTSKVTSASINWNLKIKRHFVKAIMINTKNANTFTGKQGVQSLEEIGKNLSESFLERGDGKYFMTSGSEFISKKGLLSLSSHCLKIRRLVSSNISISLLLF